MSSATTASGPNVIRPRQPRSHEHGCPGCGGPTRETTKKFCSRRCKQKGKRARRRGRVLEFVPGRCAHCGAQFAPRTVRPLCERCRRRPRGFEVFRRRVKWPHDLAWLAGKLELPPGDPRLPEVALKLAEAGELVVYLRANGKVGEVGRPKEFP